MIIRRINSTRESRMMRVAAYARVSTIKEEQEESFETQLRYYTELIQRNDRWTFVEVYADQGRSGTSISGRPAFQRMMKDARESKLDIILVKSISRFSRNVADAQKYAYELKDLGVEVRFEREAISSFDPSAEMIFNILSAVAQEESRSISENMKWSYRKLAEKGIRHIGNNHVLGYDEIRGVLTPNKDAWIIKQIYYDFVSGLYTKEIADRLNGAGARSLRGNQFYLSTILTILRNEIYVGDRRLQKRPPKNYLTHKPDPTEEYVSYYLSDDHEAIVDRETWNRAQTRLDEAESERLKQIHNRGNAHFLYGRLFCSECGMPYKRRTVKNRDGSYYKAWNCRERQKGIKGNGCKNIVIKEDELLRAIAAQMQLVTLDEDIFLRTVDRVTIGKFDIRVEMEGASASDPAQLPRCPV